MERLQEQGKVYVKKIEVERKKIEEIDKEILKYQEMIIDQKKRIGGVNAATINNQLIQKQIKVLENRLDKSLFRFNETLAHNKVLRQKIDEYRRERVVFDGIYKKLEKELHEKKKEMSLIIEDSKNAYHARDKAAAEMMALQMKAEKEKKEFEAEFKELGDLIRDQQAMLDQLRLKQLDKGTEEIVNAANTPHLPLNNNNNNSSAFLNDASYVSASNSTWSHAKDSTPIPLTQEKIQNYEAELARLKEMSGCQDIDDLVTRFLEAEEQNFSLFNYVNGINSEIERLEHSIAEIKIQIEKYRGQGMSSDTQRKKAVKDLELKLERTERKIDEFEARAVRSRKQIGQVVHSLSIYILDHSLCLLILLSPLLPTLLNHGYVISSATASTVSLRELELPLFMMRKCLAILPRAICFSTLASSSKRLPRCCRLMLPPN